MGTYVYKVSTKTITIEGLGETITANLSSYAYKPYFFCGWDDPDVLNQRMHFQSGAQGCDNAWKKRDDKPQYIVECQELNEIPELAGSAYGEGASLYATFGKVGGHGGYYHDHYIGWFHLGWVYRDTDGNLVLQYRQLNADEVDPRRERCTRLMPRQHELTQLWNARVALYGTDGRMSAECSSGWGFRTPEDANHAATLIVQYTNRHGKLPRMTGEYDEELLAA